MATYEDDLVILIADVRQAIAESVQLRRESRELRARWAQNHDELRAAEDRASDSMDKVEARRPPLLVRRWPGVHGEAALLASLPEPPRVLAARISLALHTDRGVG
jgi:hypothetical protein